LGSKLILIALAIYFVLVSWGVDPVGWIATAGVAAVAIGLAAQDTLGNLFAGISILVDTPYKIGDYIVVDRVDRGKVTRIGLRSTRILTRDDLELTIPNSIIASSKIINESAGRWVKQRLRIPVGVAYGSDADKVKEILYQAAISQEGICSDPDPWVKFDAFGDSSLNFEIRCWIEDAAQRGRVTDAVNTAVYRALAKHGIEIPFPKRDLYIKELPEGWAKMKR
jgi:small-conductance mechanosensitive channel